MNKKITITFAIAAILAVGIGSVSLSMSNNAETYLTPTDPIHFTNTDYDDRLHAQYATINPSEIRQNAKMVVKGTIASIETNSVLMVPIDPELVDENGNVIELRMDETTYVISVSKNVKNGVGRTVEVVSAIPSKIGFDIGDTVIVMANKNLDRFELTSGPHGMYKVLGEEAVGHEFTLPHKVLLE